jgi:uncharacterized protein
VTEPGTMDDATLPAGSFSSWLSGMQRALRGAGTSDVACGTCIACCTSSQFVHVGPEEAETLAAIPPELLFPAPGLPEGHLVMGYDEVGHCPMFRDGGCSIYEHRPRTCRMYDCRIYVAAGVDAPQEVPAIAEQVRRWRFTAETDSERQHQAAVREAADRLRAEDPALRPPASATRLAVLAVRHVEELPDPMVNDNRPATGRPAIEQGSLQPHHGSPRPLTAPARRPPGG